MKIAISEQLDPTPFREWCDERIRDERSDGAGGHLLSPGAFAGKLGITTDVLRVWRRSYRTLNRTELEEALRRAGYQIWDVYPELASDGDGPTHGYCPSCKEDVPVDERMRCLWCDGRAWKGRSGDPPGAQSKLTDRQVKALYELHLRGVSVIELGRRIWKQAGYSSWTTAEKGVRYGFKRLRLPVVVPTTPIHRRCIGLKTGTPNKGSRCSRYAVRGSEYCREHDPAKRQEVKRAMHHALKIQRAAA